MKTNDSTDPLKNQDQTGSKTEETGKKTSSPKPEAETPMLMDDSEEAARNASYDEVDEEINVEEPKPVPIEKALEQNGAEEESIAEALEIPPVEDAAPGTEESPEQDEAPKTEEALIDEAPQTKEALKEEAPENVDSPKADAVMETEESPVEDASTANEETPVEDVPADTEEVSVEDVTAATEEAPAEEATAATEESPAEEATLEAEESPSEDVPADAEEAPSDPGTTSDTPGETESAPETESVPEPDTESELEAGEEEEPQVNFSLLSQEDLVKLIREKLDHPARGNLRRDVEGIRKAYFDRQKQILEEKKELFLKEGGIQEDFKPVEDPLDGEIKELLNKYRGMKAEFSKQQEKSKQENLKKKQEILEEFRVLMEEQESFEITFRKFKDLQRQWFAAGIVPHSYLKDLWDSYNYFVEKFNDYVRINRELRAMDLKKNLELKAQLCERTEALDQEENLVQAFKTLQKFHVRWREIGPVPREHRDEIWERFKAATSVINKKHQAYHARMKESLQENLEKKISLCEQVEAIAEKEYTNHGTWVDRTRQVLETQKVWKSIGYAPKKENNAVYARFRKACDVFFNKKAAFYASVYEEQKSNLDLKIEIVERAEALKDSQDWKETSSELIRLQKQWKESGPVPKKHSDRLWKRFRSACDTFFNNKTQFFQDVDSSFDDNLKAKEDIVAEMDAFQVGEDRKQNMAALEEFHKRFSDIGYVPSKKKDWIREQFRQAQDRLLDRMGMDESDQSLFRFRHRIKGILQAPRADMKLNFERDKLVTKLQQLKGEIGTWENNIGFFKQSKESDDTIRGFQEKISAAHERIKLLELKIRILDNMENEN